jgi:Saxitoxin biosynthesis operon protein SxtJ
VDRPASAKELRSFGLLVGGIFSLVALSPMLLHGEPVRMWAAGMGGLLMVLGGVHPQALVPVHKGWMWVGHVLGWINTRILLGIVFYGLITPIGLVFRMMGRDSMRRAFSSPSATYRVIREPRSRTHMKLQF